MAAALALSLALTPLMIGLAKKLKYWICPMRVKLTAALCR